MWRRCLILVFVALAMSMVARANTIHQDPLRKRGKEKESITFKDSQGTIEKVIELLQSAINKNPN